MLVRRSALFAPVLLTLAVFIGCDGGTAATDTDADTATADDTDTAADTGDDTDTDTDTDTGTEVACTSRLLTRLDEVDAQGDGAFESATTAAYTYDANLELLSFVYDTNNDGTTDYRQDITRTADGLPVTESRDADADGYPEWFGTYTHRADDTLERLDVEFDDNDDGTADRLGTYLYDENGYTEREEIDSDLDGLPNTIATYEYDADGLWLDYTYDYEGDGVVDVHYAMTYNANGDLTWALTSYGSLSVYTYDGNACLIEHRYDAFGDGVLDILWSYECDGEGRQTLEEMDYNVDGTINQRIANTYDARGNLTQRDYEDRQPDEVTGTPNFRDSWTYNAEGFMLREEHDIDVNGSVDTWMEFTYDADNFLTQYDAGGEAPEARHYTQVLTNDANGYMLTYLHDEAGGGADYRGTYTYTECL